MNKIKEMRRELGYSIGKMSELSGLAPSYISNLERGIKTNPSKDVMERISEALGKTVQEVFFPEEDAI